MLLRISWINSC